MLHPGTNVLEVTFAPALEYIARMEELVGARHHVEADSYNLIRKMASNFGWDWGPRLITAGIWKPIELVAREHGRLAEVSVLATAEPAGEGGWQGRLRVAVRTLGGSAGARLTAAVTGRGAAASCSRPARCASESSGGGRCGVAAGARSSGS